jgi:hypothetical protein
VNLLHKWDFGVNQPIRREHPANLSYASPGVCNVLENGLAEHNIETAIVEGHVVRIREQVGPGGRIHIRLEKSETAIVE